MMDSLPTELLLNICKNLDNTNDFASLRLMSKALEAVASERLLSTVNCGNSHESLNALSESVNHPVFGKHISTLIFDASSLVDMDYETWVCLRMSSQRFQESISLGTLNPFSHAILHNQPHLFPAGFVPFRGETYELWRGYARQCHRERRCRDSKTTACMRTVLRTSPQLGNIVVTGQSDKLGTTRDTNSGENLGYRISQPSGTTASLLALLEAADAANHNLNSITVVQLQPSFTSSDNRIFCKAVRSLVSIRLMLDLHDLAPPDHKRPPATLESLYNILSNASELEELKLGMHNPSRRTPRSVLTDIVGGEAQQLQLHFPKLKVLSLSSMSCTEPELLAFIVAHGNTLETINLSHMCLRLGIWKNVFAALHGLRSAILINLEHFRCSGVFCSLFQPTVHDPTPSRRYVVEFDFSTIVPSGVQDQEDSIDDLAFHQQDFRGPSPRGIALGNAVETFVVGGEDGPIKNVDEIHGSSVSCSTGEDKECEEGFDAAGYGKDEFDYLFDF